MSGLRDLLDSGGMRNVGYLAVTALAVVWGVRERLSDRRHDLDWWPMYWFLSAGLVITMGIARAGSLGDWIAEFGRTQAYDEGWYDARRRYQVVAVVAVSVLWLVTVFVSVWRVPPRRRRYLANVVSLSTLVAFGGVRIISLHQIDAVLYRRGIEGVRFVSIIELGLLAMVAVTITFARLGRDRRPVGPDLVNAVATPHGSTPGGAATGSGRAARGRP